MVDEGIAHYELYLRYYLLGLRYARFPHAYHTVGSSMAVRAWAYAKQGGMNRRQAGEDFYFLNKIIALGGFTELCGTTVVPSARRSHRVPFGTGRAMTEWLAGIDRYQRVFSPELFEELRAVFSAIPDWFDDPREPVALLEELPPGIAEYLSQQNFGAKDPRDPGQRCTGRHVRFAFLSLVRRFSVVQVSALGRGWPVRW